LALIELDKKLEFIGGCGEFTEFVVVAVGDDGGVDIATGGPFIVVVVVVASLNAL